MIKYFVLHGHTCSVSIEQVEEVVEVVEEEVVEEVVEVLEEEVVEVLEEEVV